MRDRLYNGAQELEVLGDNFLWKLMNAYGSDMEELERSLRLDAKLYMSPCYAKRMRLKLAGLVKAARNRE